MIGVIFFLFRYVVPFSMILFVASATLSGDMATASTFMAAGCLWFVLSSMRVAKR